MNSDLYREGWLKIRRTIWFAMIAGILLAGAQSQQTTPARKASVQGAKSARSEAAPAASAKRRVNLSTSKILLDPAPGAAQSVNSLPLTLAVSPDGRWVASLNNGYGTRESGLRQSITILDRQSGTVTDFPDARLGNKAKQTYFLGLTFSRDGSRLYASIGSLTDPKGEKKGDTGNGIAVYSFNHGTLAPESFIPIAPQKLAPGRRPALAFRDLTPGAVAPFPAGIALLADGTMLVANNLSDNAVRLHLADGAQQQAFDLSSPGTIPAAFPYAVVATRNGARAWVSLWNASAVAELDLRSGQVARRIALLGPATKTSPGSNHTALLLTPDEKYLYVTLATRDAVAVIETASGRMVRLLSTQLPGQKYGGLYPSALAQTNDGKRLFVVNSSADAVAVFDTSALDRGGAATMPRTAMGFIPTEWYPTALAVVGDELVIATGKGKGAGPNNQTIPGKDPAARTWFGPEKQFGHPYILSLQGGSIARVNIAEAQRDLKRLTAEVLESNLMSGRAGRIEIPGGGKIRHVIYMIKENRTYDQVFGDIAGADGDPSLVMYGEQITPNQHKLARQFGVLDNFYDSGEISGNGHVWSNAAITSDYNEKIVHLNYRGKERNYDFEGVVMFEVPMEHEIPDVNEPGTGYLWTHAARHGLTHRNYGEFTNTIYCAKTEEWDAGPPPPENTPACPRKVVRKGEPLPPHLGDPPGGPSPYPWDVPLIAWTKPLKPELRNHYDPNYPYFNLSIPDQLRADEFLAEFRGFVRARETGKGTELPQLIVMQLPNDHTRGTQAGSPRPAAMVADNDLALGRIVEAVSHSPYWDDTAILVLEDDAQDGADHVDAHRSIALVISKYAPRATGEMPVVHHQFYTTVNMVRTVEALLGLPPMNNNDAQAAVMAPLFSGAGDQPPFKADWRNRDNGLLYQMNPPKAPGSMESAAMDWSRPDAADSEKLNAILWREAKGDVPMPEPIYAVVPKRGGRD